MPYTPCFAAATILLVIAGTARAGDTQPQASEQQTQDKGNGWSVTVSTSPTFTFRSDLEDNAGRVSVFRNDAGVSLAGPVGDRLRLTWGVSAGYANYDFSGFRPLGGVEPLDNAYEVGSSLLAVYKIDDQWSVVARGSVTSGWAEDGSFGNGIWGTGAAGVGYKFSDSFSLALGGGFITRLEDNVAFLPLVVVNWRISDKLTLATTGVGLKLTGALSDTLAAYLRAGGEFHQYRLDDNLAPLPKGVLNDTRVPVGVGLEWKPCGGLTLGVEGGAIVYQQYELRDNDGHRVDRTETDPAAYIGGSVSFRF